LGATFKFVVLPLLKNSPKIGKKQRKTQEKRMVIPDGSSYKHKEGEMTHQGGN